MLMLKYKNIYTGYSPAVFRQSEGILSPVPSVWISDEHWIDRTYGIRLCFGSDASASGTKTVMAGSLKTNGLAGQYKTAHI